MAPFTSALALPANHAPRKSKMSCTDSVPEQSKSAAQNVNTAGALVTVNTYRLYLPVGTDIKVGDEVVVGGDDVYIVSDTTAESTWMAVLECSLRKRD